LRIRIVYQGKKHQFSTGLADTKTNRAYVQGIASRIQLDMVSGQFDPTLLKYRSNAVGSNPVGISCPEFLSALPFTDLRSLGYPLVQKVAMPALRGIYRHGWMCQPWMQEIYQDGRGKDGHA
jgi:hypothetical protein